MGAEYISSGDKNIRTFKKPEISKLIQLTMNRFLSSIYKRRRSNQIEDTYTFYKKEAIIINHLMVRYIILRGENLDLMRKFKLNKYKITRYSLADERKRKGEDSYL